MPASVRPSGKAAKIAKAIMGIPPAEQGKRLNKKIRNRLLTQSTHIIR